MKLSLASSRRSVDVAIRTDAVAVLLNAMCPGASFDDPTTARPVGPMLELPKIQGSIFLTDFSHLLRGHG